MSGWDHCTGGAGGDSREKSSSSAASWTGSVLRGALNCREGHSWTGMERPSEQAGPANLLQFDTWKTFRFNHSPWSHPAGAPQFAAEQIR